MLRASGVWSTLRAHLCLWLELGMVFLATVGVLHVVNALYYWGVGRNLLLLLEMVAVVMFLSYGFVTVRRYWNRL